MSFTTLSASYTSPTNNPFSLSLSLPSPQTNNNNPLSIAEKTSRLAALRAAVADAQAAINRELTDRMEEDKARDAATSKDGAAVDDAKEEENYGEEVQEDED